MGHWCPATSLPASSLDVGLLQQAPRALPLQQSESPDSLYRTYLLAMQPSPTSQVITTGPKLLEEAAAENCAKKLRLAFLRDSILVFNLLILGVDPNGSPLLTLPRPQSPA